MQSWLLKKKITIKTSSTVISVFHFNLINSCFSQGQRHIVIAHGMKESFIKIKVTRKPHIPKDLAQSDHPYTNQTVSSGKGLQVLQPQEKPGLLKAPPERAPRNRSVQPSQASMKSVKFEEPLSPKQQQKTPKMGRRAHTDDDATSYHTMRLDSAPMPDLPQEVIDKELFNKLSPHDRPLNFKCKNIIDAQHRRLYADDMKPLTEMYAHISDSSNSSLFPGNAAILLQAVSSGSSKSSRSSSAGKHDYARIARTLKAVSKPKVFPSLLGKDYTYGFEVLWINLKWRSQYLLWVKVDRLEIDFWSFMKLIPGVNGI